MPVIFIASFFFDSLYLLSSYKSDYLDDVYDEIGSDSGSSSTYYFYDFSLHFDDYVGIVSVLGSGVFTTTGVESKCGRLIKCFGAQIIYFISKFETQFYSYSHS